jgi:hypothetical protein
MEPPTVHLVSTTREYLHATLKATAGLEKQPNTRVIIIVQWCDGARKRPQPEEKKQPEPIPFWHDPGFDAGSILSF